GLAPGHAAHAEAADRVSRLREAPAIHVSGVIADSLRRGDEKAMSIDVAKQAGIYPLDYHLEPFPGDHELEEGATIEVGQLRLSVFDTPGHSDGQVSLLLEDGRRRILFAGDVIFFGGKVLLQNIHDCRVHALLSSLRLLRGLSVTDLLPRHR